MLIYNLNNIEKKLFINFILLKYKNFKFKILLLKNCYL